MPRSFGHVVFPRTYRANFLRRLGGCALAAWILLFLFGNSSPPVFFAIQLFCLFLFLNLFVSRVVLYDDRIESISLAGVRSLPKMHIERLETICYTFRGWDHVTCRLIPRRGQGWPMLLPAALTKDAVWHAWRGEFGEVIKTDEPALGDSRREVAVAFGFVVIVMLQKFLPGLLHVFDTLNLLLPWCACVELYLGGCRSGPGRWAFGGSDPRRISARGLVLLLAMFIPPLYLLKFRFGENVFVVGADSLLPVCIAIAMSLASLVFLRFSPLEAVNLRAAELALAVGFAGLYGYGATITINEVFDTSRAQTTKVVIEKKFIETGKRRDYFFLLAPWGPETRSRKYQPSLSVYRRLRPSDTICAALHQGVFGIRWYRLSEDCSE